jgi:hypothetical protein
LTPLLGFELCEVKRDPEPSHDVARRRNDARRAGGRGDSRQDALDLLQHELGRAEEPIDLRRQRLCGVVRELAVDLVGERRCTLVLERELRALHARLAAYETPDQDAASHGVINRMRPLVRRSVIDFELLFEELIAARKPLAFEGLASGPEFRALATSLETLSLRGARRSR